MFDYGQWQPGTRISLVNVRWDNSYGNIVNWRDYSRNNYFSSLEQFNVVINKMTYCAPNRPVRISIPYAKAFKYNYIVVKNAQTVDDDATYYYFITNMRYIAPNTTEVLLQLDVWTTYYDRFSFGRSFVVRGHIAGWLDNKYGTNDHREYLCRPEGLDVGSNYLIGDVSSWSLGNKGSGLSVVIMSTVSLTKDYGDESNPKLKSAGGTITSQVPYATENYFCDFNKFYSVMTYLSDYPWVSQGIISVTIVPTSTIDVQHSATQTMNGGKGPSLNKLTFFTYGTTHTFYNDFRTTLLACIPERYRSLKKFACSPYSYLEVTTYSGTPITVAPETISSAAFQVKQWVNPIAPGARIMYTIPHLNEHGSHPGGYDGYAEHLDVMTGITNLPSLPIVNNSAIGYIASNAHSIAYAKESAAWQQSKAVSGAQWAASAASSGINASYAQTANSNSLAAQQLAIGINARNASWGVNTAFGVGTGIAQGAVGGAAGGPVGAIAGAATGGLTAGVSAAQSYFNNQIANDAASQSTSASINAANTSQQISAEQAAYVRDGNLDLAMSNARGDFANAIAGINAKIQDAQLTPPSISGQLGGDILNLHVQGYRVDVRMKIPHMGVIRTLGEYWFRYGYTLNEWIDLPDSLMCMQRLTYWQCIDVNVWGPVPADMIEIVRGMLQRGVSVYASPDLIGTMDPANNGYKEAL